jgi:hypothetical protein
MKTRGVFLYDECLNYEDDKVDDAFLDLSRVFDRAGLTDDVYLNLPWIS